MTKRQNQKIPSEAQSFAAYLVAVRGGGTLAEITLASCFVLVLVIEGTSSSTSTSTSVRNEQMR